MRSFFIKSAKVIAYLAFVVLAVIYVPKIMSKVLKTPYPMATITSGSMWPVLKTNDLILMKGASGSDVKVGQIIIFKNSQGFTIHRLIRKEKTKLVTKGDANDVEDTPIDPSAVVGRVVYVGKNPVRVPLIGVIAKNLAPKLSDLKAQ